MTAVATRKPATRQSFGMSFTVNQAPEEVFEAVTNVRGWWSSDLVGKSARQGDVFTFQYADIHKSTQKLVEVVPGRKVVWLVQDASLNFTKDKGEWKGTKVVFEIVPKGRKTELRFTHDGLTPALECFDACSGGWTYYVGESLRELITTGKGRPE